MAQKIKLEAFHQEKTLIFFVVIFSLAALLFGLGKRSLWEPDEGRYAEISREMLESRDFLTPRLNYIKHFDKPPITYWLIASSFKLFGLNESAAHLPLLLLGLGGVLAVFFLGEKLFNRRSGFLSAIILTSSLGYPALAHVLSADIIFSFFCLLCYLFFVQKKYLFFYLSLALGFMTKGPVVFIITLVPIIFFLLYEKERHILKEMSWGWGLVLFAALALPWYIYEILHNQGLLNDWFFQHTLSRILHRREQPFYFFVPVLLGLFFPWIFFGAPALKRKLSFQRLSFNKEQAKVFLLFLWFALPFLFFACIGKKLIPYLLPLLPPQAIIVGRMWDEAMDKPREILSSKIFTVSYYLFLSSLLIFLLGLVAFLSLGYDYRLNLEAARPSLIVMSLILLSAIIASLSFFKLKKAKHLFWAIALASLFFFLSAIELLPKIEINANRSIKPLALKIKEDLKPEDKVVNYRCFLKSLPFYLGRRTIVVERERNLVYEEGSEKNREYLLQDKEELYNLLSHKEFQVYCITYTWEFDQIKRDYERPLYLLGQAGKYVLFTNQMGSASTK